jgi:prevent-host-death family protein
MTTVTLKDAKNRLSELGHKAEKGETIIVTRHGKPAFDLVPHKKSGGTNWEAGEAFLKAHGVDRLVSWVSPDFDDPLPEDFLIRPLPKSFDKPRRRRKK